MPLIQVDGWPKLHEPVLVVALSGWVDAGMAEATAPTASTRGVAAEPTSRSSVTRTCQDVIGVAVTNVSVATRARECAGSRTTDRVQEAFQRAALRGQRVPRSNLIGSERVD